MAAQTLEVGSTVAVEVPPSRVPQRGLPPRAALALVVVAVASIVGFAILGKTPVVPAPASSPAAALVSPVADAPLDPDRDGHRPGRDSSGLRGPARRGPHRADRPPSPSPGADGA